MKNSDIDSYKNLCDFENLTGNFWIKKHQYYELRVKFKLMGINFSEGGISCGTNTFEKA